MTERDDWGPWVEHDGTGRPPHPVGTLMRIVAEIPHGRIVESEGPMGDRVEPWDWRWFGRPGPRGRPWVRILRYCVRRPRALLDLIEMVETLPSPTEAEPA